MKSRFPYQGIHIDLTWGLIGAEVDLHFRPPDGAGYSGYNYGNNCAYYNKNPDWGDHGYPDDNPVLNYDCITTCADENIQLEEVGQNGIYKVVIHNFHNHGKGNATATVTVYYNGEQVALGRRTLANRGDSPEKGDVWIPYQVTVKQTGEVTVKNLDEVTVDNADDGAPFPKEEPGTY